MNERIKELAEQSGVFVGDFAGAGIYSIHNKDEVEKFAELIVKECQTVVDWAISVDSTIDRVPVLIKEHFGVEQ